MRTTAQALAPGRWSENPLSDEEIVGRVCLGEVALFEVLMRRHNQLVFRSVRGLLRDPDEVEDVMQEAYLSAYAHLGQFSGAARFSTWLVRIALNAAIGRLRRRGRLVGIGGIGDLDTLAEQDGSMTRDPRGARDPEAQAGDGELIAALERAVDRLPEIYRCVFMLREVEGLSTTESAACLDVSEETVKVRLHRAKALLRQDLQSVAQDAFHFQGARCDRIVAAVLARLYGSPRPGRPPGT